MSYLIRQLTADPLNAVARRSIVLGCATIVALAGLGRPALSFATSSARTISVVADGAVARRPDVAYVEASIGTRGDLSPISAPVPRHDIVAYELKARLQRFGGERKISWLSPRRIEITVDKVADAAHAAASITWLRYIHVIGIRYALKDGGSAYREALRIALEDARTRAQRNAAEQQMQLGALQRVAVLPYDRARLPVAVVPFRITRTHGGFGFDEPYIRIPELRISVSATVTYAIKP